MCLVRWYVDVYVVTMGAHENRGSNFYMYGIMDNHCSPPPLYVTQMEGYS